MSWFEHAEQKRKLLIGGTIVICIAMLIVTTRRNNVSLDSFWHLKMGLDWLGNNLSLWRDHYSFTYYGEQINGPPYIFEILLGSLVTHFGIVTGFEVFKFSAFLLAFGLVILFLRQLRAPVVIYCLVLPLIVVLLQFRSFVRPEILSYSFVVIAVMLYYRARNSLSVANLLPIIALMLVWTNYHSPIFGYIIFFGYFVDIALLQLHERAPVRAWIQWLGWGIVIVAVGFLKPGFNHPLIQLLHFSPEWKSLIQEYQSAFAYRDVAAIYSLIAIAFFTLVVLLRNRQFGLFIVSVLLILFSIDMIRLVAPSGIAILCIFAWVASEIDFDFQLQRLPRALNHVVGSTVIILFVLSLFSTVHLARIFMVENKTSGLMFPKDVVDYMIDNGISGRIFNDYGIGGYLIYRLSPESQVYIDGRTGILYPLDHFYRLTNAEKSPEILRAEIEEWDINLAVMSNKQRNFSLARDTGSLGLDYIGSKYTLFRRDNPNFPVVGTLLAYPACWDASMSLALEQERVRAISVLSENSSIIPFIDFMIEYTNAEDRLLFLGDLEGGRQWSAPMLRFAGSQALNHNLNSTAYELFTGIKKKQFGDYLGAAVAKAQLGEWEIAEQLLDDATRLLWSENFSEISILHGLLVHIDQNKELELFDTAYVNRMAEKVGAKNDSSSPSAPDGRSFCPSISSD